MSQDGQGSTLRELLASAAPVIAPGVALPLFARLAADAGFSAGYLSGAALANFAFGEPDVGLTTSTEVHAALQRITAVTSLPMIVDADTGYGGVGNVARTVRELIRAGAAAIQLEDQTFPKRCGHFADKQVVEVPEMLERLAAATDARGHSDVLLIARTDALAPLGLDAALGRAQAYASAGADILFVEAPRSVADFEVIGRELAGHVLMANMVEFGRSPLLPAAALHDLGFSLVIYPGAITRSVTRTVRELLAALHADGTTESFLDRMAHFDEVNTILGLPARLKWEDELRQRASEAGS